MLLLNPGDQSSQDVLDHLMHVCLVGLHELRHVIEELRPGKVLNAVAQDGHYPPEVIAQPVFEGLIAQKGAQRIEGLQRDHSLVSCIGQRGEEEVHNLEEGS